MKKDKNYYETYCKQILKVKFTKFNSLINADKPDLQGKEIGIEVTRAIIEPEARMKVFVDKYLDNRYDDMPKKELNSLGFYDNPILINQYLYKQQSKENGMLIYLLEKATNSLRLCSYIRKNGDCNSSDENISITAINNKLEKLNKPNLYTLFKENDLAIIINEQLNYVMIKDEIINSIVKDIIAKTKEIYEKKSWVIYYDYIYLVYMDYIFEINTYNWKYIALPITQNDIDLLKFDNVNE